MIQEAPPQPPAQIQVAQFGPNATWSSMTLRKFSLDEMRILAEAVLENSQASPSILGRQLGRHRASVHHVIRRLRDAGGWYTMIVWNICLHCGEPLPTSGSAHGIGPTKYHAHCRQDCR